MSVLSELQAIEERDGILNPQAVVDFARDPKTELHKKFEWENETAGDQYRLWQARKIITAQVVVANKQQKSIEVQAFVSITSDRHPQGGYRSIVSVMSDDELREKMLADAKRDFQTFKRRYQDLTELATVFQELEHVFA